METLVLCPRCKERPRPAGRGYCQPCQTEYQRAWRAGEIEPKKRKDGLCPRCTERPAEEARSGYCTQCSNEKAAEWRTQNRAKHNATAKSWRERNPEKVKESKRKRARTEVLRRHGLTESRYAEMLVEQNGCCAICSVPPVEEVLHVDHDHETGEVRGLLCRPCNTALGLMQDIPERLIAAAGYLIQKKEMA